MSDTDQTQGGPDQGSPEDDMDENEKALIHLSKIIEARRALPWEQWTFREKLNYYVDRLFLGILVIFILMLLGEFAYKMWYVTNVKMITEFVSDSFVFLFDWLFTQAKQEELAEL